VIERIIDGTPIPLFVIDSRHNVTYWNKAIEALTGICRDNIIGTSKHWQPFYERKKPLMADLIVDMASWEEIESYYPGHCQESSLLDGACEAEGYYPSLGETGRWLFFTASPIRDENGDIIGAVETLQDATERKHAEEALQASEQSYRELFDGALDAIWVHDLKGNILKANGATARMTGLSNVELAKANIKDFLSKRSLRTTIVGRHRLNEDFESLGKPHKQHIIRKDGTELTLMCTTRPIFYDGQLVAFQNIAWDISEQSRMQENLRYYMQQVTIAQEEERKRIARDLHDDIAQSLLLVMQGLDMLSSTKRPKLTNTQLKRYLERLRNQAVEALEAVRRCAQDMRPRIIDDLGLVAALEWLTDDLSKYGEVDARAEITGEERALPGEVQLLLFRIAQEALNNVRKHAHATSMILKMAFDDDKLTLVISDNGSGFKVPEMLGDLAGIGKLGLTGMQERAKLIGGKLTIESELGKGTTVMVKVPLSE
jgi:two-component system sensor histidine kinase DegS